MKIKNDKAIQQKSAFNIVINGVQLNQDAVNKILSRYKQGQPAEKLYKNAISRLKKNVQSK